VPSCWVGWLNLFSSALVFLLPCRIDVSSTSGLNLRTQLMEWSSTERGLLLLPCGVESGVVEVPVDAWEEDLGHLELLDPLDSLLVVVNAWSTTSTCMESSICTSGAMALYYALKPTEHFSKPGLIPFNVTSSVSLNLCLRIGPLLIAGEIGLIVPGCLFVHAG